MGYFKVLLFFMLMMPTISVAQFSTFVPSQRSIESMDVSIIERSLQRLEAKRNAAYENLAQLKVILGGIRSQLNDDYYTQKWFSDYSYVLLADVENRINEGNTGIASSIAKGYIQSIPTDPRILKLIQISNEYKGVKQHVISKYWKGDITSTALDCWLDNNPCWTDESTLLNSLFNDYHWYPTYMVSNSIDLDDLCNYVKYNTSKKEDYFEYACKYVQQHNGNLDQELKGFLYLSKITKQKLRRESNMSSYDIKITEENPYARIIPYNEKDLKQFVINLVDKWHVSDTK